MNNHVTEGSFEGVDGVNIFTREWQPASEPRGVVVISHGLNAHSGLYEWAGSSDRTLKLYEGHFHDLLADVGKQQVGATHFELNVSSR